MKLSHLFVFLATSLVRVGVCSDLQVLRTDLSGAPTASVWVRVRQDGRDIFGLTTAAFRIDVNGTDSPIQSVSAEPEPKTEDALAAMFVIDASGSTRGLTIVEAKRTAQEFISRLRTVDLVGCARAGSKPRVLIAPTTDRTLVLNSIDQIGVGGRSALLDTIANAIPALKSVPALRKTVILLSDGKENASKATVREVLGKLRAESVELHVLLVGDTRPGPWMDLCGKSGGSFIELTDKAKLATAFASLAKELTTVYRLRFVLPDMSFQTASIKITQGSGTNAGEIDFSLAIPGRLDSTQSGDGPRQSPALFGVIGLAALDVVLVTLLLGRSRGKMVGRANQP